MTGAAARVPDLAPGRAPDRAPDRAAAVELLQAIADPVRLSVMRRLARSPACVCTIQEDLPIAANLLSYHLKVLREAGLVTTTRRGRWIDYTLAPDALDRLHAAIPAPE
ncbi:MAG TPA: metalloregulator ArsR/SmtB family transcription factor [Streptosporangiaceae bacterium]|nr:metalloregulator ArsR/SmtB family transcription factor [Streptosporangiaceae bacterium]